MIKCDICGKSIMAEKWKDHQERCKEIQKMFPNYKKYENHIGEKK